MTAHSAAPLMTAQEYDSTLAAIRRLEAGLAQEEAYRGRRDPQVHQLVVAGIEGFLEDLRAQAADYEARRATQKTHHGGKDD